VAEEILGSVDVLDDWRAQLGAAEALIVRSADAVTERDLEGAPSLRVIGRNGVGVERVDVAAATRRGIPVVIVPGAGSNAVAEGALAMILALAKQLAALDSAVRDGRWEVRDELEVRDLEGATLGIVGLGRIGRRLAELAQPFDARVLGYDPYVDDPAGAEVVDLPTLFGESDFISLHAPLTEETRGLVDADLLSVARKAVLVNLSRGGLVSSLDDLLAALEAGSLAAVGLDVFEPEPPDPSHPLFRHPRVLLTPHALGLSSRARRQIYTQLAEGVAAVLRGERAAHVANPEVYA
jgi:D-3-phosphoglycerate dehydrogenase / 2-oxoglutarate reductase